MDSEFEAELQDGVDVAQAVHHIASARHIVKNLRVKVDDAERRGEFGRGNYEARYSLESLDGRNGWNGVNCILV